MKLKIGWFRSSRILILESSMNLQISRFLLSVFSLWNWSKTLGISSVYYSELQTNWPTELLIYFPTWHSGCVNPGGQHFSGCPGFWQDHPACLEEAKPFYNCFDLRLPQQRFLLDKTFWFGTANLQGETLQPVFQMLTLFWLVMQTTTHRAHSQFLDSDLMCLATASLISCSIFVPYYDLDIRMLFTFYKLQTEIVSYWTAPLLPSGYCFTPVQQSVWATETDTFHLVFEIWPSFCTF